MKVIVKQSKIHGKGCFANKDISKGELVGIYKGTPAKTDGTYILWVDDQPWYIRNKLRYANHSYKPNCELEEFHLFALKNIKQDEEITIHYGEDWK